MCNLRNIVIASHHGNLSIGNRRRRFLEALLLPFSDVLLAKGHIVDGVPRQCTDFSGVGRFQDAAGGKDKDRITQMLTA